MECDAIKIVLLGFQQTVKISIGDGDGVCCVIFVNDMLRLLLLDVLVGRCGVEAFPVANEADSGIRNS